jgi:hypothetical protein
MNKYAFTDKWVGGQGYVIIFKIEDAVMRALDTLAFPQYPKDVQEKITAYQLTIGKEDNLPVIMKFAAEKEVHLFIHYKDVFDHFEQEIISANLTIFKLRE